MEVKSALETKRGDLLLSLKGIVDLEKILEYIFRVKNLEVILCVPTAKETM